MSVAESALPGIEAGRVERWLAGHVDGLAAPVVFGLISGGRSNLTYRLTDAAGAAYALRRPPTGGVLSTAHDVSREWRFISALAPTAVPSRRVWSPTATARPRSRTSRTRSCPSASRPADDRACP